MRSVIVLLLLVGISFGRDKKLFNEPFTLLPLTNVPVYHIDSSGVKRPNAEKSTIQLRSEFFKRMQGVFLEEGDKLGIFVPYPFFDTIPAAEKWFRAENGMVLPTTDFVRDNQLATPLFFIVSEIATSMVDATPRTYHEPTQTTYGASPGKVTVRIEYLLWDAVKMEKVTENSTSGNDAFYGAFDFHDWEEAAAEATENIVKIERKRLKEIEK